LPTLPTQGVRVGNSLILLDCNLSYHETNNK
jgi:hypothetical protein